jgi:hypothetical protein
MLLDEQSHAELYLDRYSLQSLRHSHSCLFMRFAFKIKHPLKARLLCLHQRGPSLQLAVGPYRMLVHASRCPTTSPPLTEFVC